jgi:hypothetical protein
MAACLCLVSQALAQEGAGNALNPRGADRETSPVAERDPDGSGISEHSRTPTGFLLTPPARPRTAMTSGGWRYDLGVELGGLGAAGDSTNAKFREYKDWSSGFYLNTFNLSLEKQARFIVAQGGGVGRDDQFYTAVAGKYNAWRVQGFLTETPHVFTSAYRSLWTGLRTDTLKLVSVQPGGTTDAPTTQAAIQTALSTTPFSDVALARTKAGMRFNLTLSENWKAFTNYTREHRDGARQFGMVFGGGGGGGNVEAPESVSNTEDDIVAGVTYSRGRTNLNLAATAAWFRNDIDVLTVENPLFITVSSVANVPATTFTRGRFDMHPDNHMVNVRADLAHAVPSLAQSRFTAVASQTRYRQNDPLQPWTELSLAGGLINGVSTTNVWNTADALTRTTADATIDTTLFDASWQARARPNVGLKARFRSYDTDNDTTFWACNPLTGQWGRLVNDGSGGSFSTPHLTAGNNPAGTTITAYNGTACDPARTIALGLVPHAGNTIVRNIPFAYGRTNASIGADYDLTRRNSVEINYERENYSREHRERERTWENRIKGTYVNRGLPYGTLRASYEYGRRRGSDYEPDPYGTFVSGQFGPLPSALTTNVASWFHAVAQLRKFDLADRNQQVINTRWNIALLPAVDVAVNFTGRTNSYPTSQVGRDERQWIRSPNVDLIWQATEERTATAFYSYQTGRLHQTAITPNGCVLGNTYYFFSDGSIQTNATGDVPNVPAGLALVATERVLSSNWPTLCVNAADTSPLFPTSRAWTVTHRDRNHTAGLGFRESFKRIVTSVNYTYLDGRSSVGYAYNAAGLGITPVQASLAGSGHPDTLFRQHLLDLDALAALAGRAGLHFIYRYERGQVRDWAYDGILENPVPAANAVYLDAGPIDYSAHVFGVFLRLER